MGKRGPKKKSDDELRASGSRIAAGRGDEIELERPQSGKGNKTPPSWLTHDEVEIWEEFLPIALEMKTYQKADRFAFGLFCRAARDLLAVQKAVKEEGTVFDATFFSKDGELKSTPKKHPLVDVERIKRDSFLKLADQFGFNPLARTRLKIVPYQKAPAPSVPDAEADPIEGDEFDNMMGIKKTE